MQRQLVEIRGNDQKLDGGSMFGNAPRALWERWAEPDEVNRIRLATRALLVLEENRTILFETGVGTFFEPQLRERFGVSPDDRHVLLDNLGRNGLSHEDIDVVVLSHLHFDHAGGLLAPWEEGQPPRLLFPKARYIVSGQNFARAARPHARDRASFIPELPALLERSGRLELVDGERSETLGGSYRLHRSDGHTPGMLVTEIATDDGPVVFVADLAPGRAWTHAAISMGYDRNPELIVNEKLALFPQLIERRARLYYTHDPEVAIVRLASDDKGRFFGADL
jgi:glyoxylase-like metal-dependent hydrolase (beta-lactamase superfamily II)